MKWMCFSIMLASDEEMKKSASRRQSGSTGKVGR